MAQKKTQGEQKPDKKARNWTFLVYPESAPSTWMDTLQESGVQFAVSPLHDKDTNPTGEPKKAHFHVLVCFDGPTTYNAVCTLIEPFKGPIPKVASSASGIYRYFTHMDNPEKYQYNASDIRCFNGFDPASFVTKTEIDRIVLEIQSIIRNLNITEYADLMDYLQDNCMYEFFGIASNHTLFFDRYISSRRHKNGSGL